MDYYKITNKKENHNGLIFKTGVNIDIQPILETKRPYCVSGGLYFASIDILAFLDYGYWIRKVSFLKGEKIYDIFGKPKKYKAHRLILSERIKIDKDVILALINEGADQNVKDYFDRTPLMWAAKNNKIAICKVLLYKKADTDAKDKDGCTALMYALISRNIEIAKLLIANGADVNKEDDEGRASLMYAVRFSTFEVVSLMLDRYAEIDLKDEKGRTPLMIACKYCDIRMIRVIVEKGADITIKDKKGWTALRYAQKYGCIEGVDFLQNLPII